MISIGPASRLARPEVQDMIEVEISELGINKCAYNYTLYTLPCLYGMTNAEYDHEALKINREHVYKQKVCSREHNYYVHKCRI